MAQALLPVPKAHKSYAIGDRLERLCHRRKIGVTEN